MDFNQLSRRDFLKKTTVLAVGVASVTLFSGLVNALGAGYAKLCESAIITGYCTISPESSLISTCIVSCQVSGYGRQTFAAICFEPVDGVPSDQFSDPRPPVYCKGSDGNPGDPE